MHAQTRPDTDRIAVRGGVSEPNDDEPLDVRDGLEFDVAGGGDQILEFHLIL